MGHQCGPGCCYESTWVPRPRFLPSWVRLPIVDRDPGDEHREPPRSLSESWGPSIFETLYKRMIDDLWKQTNERLAREFAQLMPVLKPQPPPAYFWSEWDPFGIRRRYLRRVPQIPPPIFDRDPGDES